MRRLRRRAHHDDDEEGRTPTVRHQGHPHCWDPLSPRAPREMDPMYFLQRDSITEKPAPSFKLLVTCSTTHSRQPGVPLSFNPGTVTKPHAFPPLSSVLIPLLFVFFSLSCFPQCLGTVLYRAASHRPLHAQDPYPVYLILNRRAPLGARRPFSAARRYHGGLPTPPRLTKKQAGGPQLTVSAAPLT